MMSNRLHNKMKFSNAFGWYDNKETWENNWSKNNNNNNDDEDLSSLQKRKLDLLNDQIKIAFSPIDININFPRSYQDFLDWNTRQNIYRMLYWSILEYGN